MKKIGKLTEARMVIPEEPKVYPLVSDKNFKGTVAISENKMKGYPEKGIKGGTQAAAKEFARRKKKGKLEEELPMNRRGRITQPGGAPKVDPGTYQTYNSMTDAKDPNWIQDAEKDIKRRGTEGKCTPITKPGCTGRAKALAKTFKKMAKKRDAKIVSKKEKAAMKEQDTNNLKDSPTRNFSDPKYATPEMRKRMKDTDDAIKKFQATLKR